jgi:hypothetical protein
VFCLMRADGAEGYKEVLRSDRGYQAVSGGEVPRSGRGVRVGAGLPRLTTAAGHGRLMTCI